jgi:hypothetical protein
MSPSEQGFAAVLCPLRADSNHKNNGPNKGGLARARARCVRRSWSGDGLPAKDKKTAHQFRGVRGIEGFFRQVYVISPINYLVFVGGVFGLVGGGNRKKKILATFLNSAGTTPQSPQSPQNEMSRSLLNFEPEVAARTSRYRVTARGSKPQAAADLRLSGRVLYSCQERSVWGGQRECSTMGRTVALDPKRSYQSGEYHLDCSEEVKISFRNMRRFRRVQRQAIERPFICPFMQPPIVWQGSVFERSSSMYENLQAYIRNASHAGQRHADVQAI